MSSHITQLHEIDYNKLTPFVQKEYDRNIELPEDDFIIIINDTKSE